MPLLLVIVVYVLIFVLARKIFFLISICAVDANENNNGPICGNKFNAEMKGCDLETKRNTGFVSKTQLLDRSSQKPMLSQKIRKVDTFDLKEKLGSEECLSSEHDQGFISEFQEKLINYESDHKGGNHGEIVTDMANHKAGEATNEEIGVFKSDVKQGEINGLKESLLDEEDDWEGIETSELESQFGAAVLYVGSKSNSDKISSLSSDLKFQLYGLHQVAIEGPCHVPQPMAFKVSARSKWNAWQRLGNMSSEVAMEQYINLLSTSIPEWMRDDYGDVSKQDFADKETTMKLVSDSVTFVGSRQGVLDERNLGEVMPHLEGLDVGSSSLKMDKSQA